MKFNLAITLTWFRIAAIPLFILCFYLPWEFSRPLAGIVFVAAAVTDILDGYIARRLNQITEFGAFLDPVADKLIVATALVMLVQADPRFTLTMIAAIIIGREIAVSALREWMANVGSRSTVAVSVVGKFKTVLQMTGLSTMIWQHDLFGLPTYNLGFLCLLVAAGLTLWSMFIYIRAAWPALAEGMK